MAVELIVTIVFGVVMLVIALISLWQDRRAKSCTILMKYKCILIDYMFQYEC